MKFLAMPWGRGGKEENLCVEEVGCAGILMQLAHVLKDKSICKSVTTQNEVKFTKPKIAIGEQILFSPGGSLGEQAPRRCRGVC